MTWTFKLSKRLAIIFAAAIGGSFGGCTDRVPSAVGSTEVPRDQVDAVDSTLFTDGFESGSLAWDDNFDPQAKSIVAAAARTGTRGLRLTFTPTANGGTLAKFVERGNRLYVRAAVRFPTNWTGATGLLTLRAAPAANPWASFGKALVCPDGGTWAVTGAYTTEPSLNLAFHTYFVGMRTLPLEACPGSAGLASKGSTATYTAPLTVTKGGWHVVELEAQLNTVGMADGWQKMWLDGTLKGEWTGLTFRTRPAVQWNAVSLELASSGVTQTQTLDIDDIVVQRARPADPAPAAPVETVLVTPATATLDPAQSLNLTATLRDVSGNLLTNRAVAWSSSNPAVASVSATGAVLALVAGTATISAASEGKIGSAAITVRAPAPAGAVLFSEAFDDALFGNRGWYDFASPVVTTVDKHSGTGSLEIQWAAGATNASIGVMRRLFTPTERLYVSYWVKYSTNYVGSSVAYHPHEFSVLSNQDQDWDGLTYNYLNTYIEQNYQNGGIPRVAIQDSRMIDTTQIGVNLTGITENRSLAGCNGNSDGTGVPSCFQSTPTQWYNAKEWDAAAVAFQPVAGPDYKSNWNHVEVELQLNSIGGGIGEANGIVRYWLNGNLKLERTNVLFRTGANPDLKFHQFLLTPYFSDGSPVAQTMWVDDLVLATARVGGTQTPPPPPPPPPAPVATVSVTPNSATVAVGSTVQLNAVTRDAAGAILIGRTIAWATSAPSIATVVNGVVTGRGAGQATITATSEGRSGTATVTVPAAAPPPPPPPAGRYPHEPAGAIRMVDYDAALGSAVATSPETAAQPFNYIAGAGNLATVQDPTAPISPPYVGQVTFHPGLLAGTGPAHLASGKLFVPPSDWTRYYLSYHWKYSSNFVAASNEVKHLDVWLGDDFYIAGTWGVLPPFPSHQRKFTALTGPAELGVNVWHQYEIVLTRQAGGVRAQLYVNGNLRRDDVLPYANTSIVQLSWGFIYGGTGVNPPTTMQMLIDHMYASYTR